MFISKATRPSKYISHSQTKNVYSCFQDPVGEIIFLLLLDVLFFLSFFFYLLKIFLPILSAWSSSILWLMATSPDRSFHIKHCGCKWTAAWEICPATTSWKKMSVLVQQHTSLGIHCRKHPKSAVCCYSTLASAVPMLLLLILFLFPLY